MPPAPRAPLGSRAPRRIRDLRWNDGGAAGAPRPLGSRFRGNDEGGSATGLAGGRVRLPGFPRATAHDRRCRTDAAGAPCPLGSRLRGNDEGGFCNGVGWGATEVSPAPRAPLGSRFRGNDGGVGGRRPDPACPWVPARHGAFRDLRGNDGGDISPQSPLFPLSSLLSPLSSRPPSHPYPRHPAFCDQLTECPHERVHPVRRRR